jgi:hypothetical protein
MDESKNRMLRVLGKFNKIVKVKDIEDQEVDIKISYPTMENSAEFWDIMYTINANSAMAEKAEENASELSSLLLPKIIKYVISNIEHKEGREFSQEEKDYYYLLIISNTTDVINAFMEMTALIFNKGDVPKNPQQAGQLQTE